MVCEMKGERGFQLKCMRVMVKCFEINTSINDFPNCNRHTYVCVHVWFLYIGLIIFLCFCWKTLDAIQIVAVAKTNNQEQIDAASRSAYMYSCRYVCLYTVCKYYIFSVKSWCWSSKRSYKYPNNNNGNRC